MCVPSGTYQVEEEEEEVEGFSSIVEIFALHGRLSEVSKMLI